jgi:hypothetical protein
VVDFREEGLVRLRRIAVDEVARAEERGRPVGVALAEAAQDIGLDDGEALGGAAREVLVGLFAAQPLE